MIARLKAHRNGRLLTRVGVLSFVFVLLCVPALTRIGQKLQAVSPISQAPSFAKNIECPPRKVTVPAVVAIAAVALLEGDEAPVAPVAVSLNLPLPVSASSPVPAPLRAPPLPRFA